MTSEWSRIDLSDYDYDLPAERIAQEPAAERDGARLLRLDRANGAREHGRIPDLARWLEPGDLLVRNATRVLPARLRGHKSTGGAAEALLLGPGSAPRRYRALVRARGRLRVGQKLGFEREALRAEAEIVALASDGSVELVFADEGSPYALGETPLPPYIARDAAREVDAERYQTIYARASGSVAAPTAGLHLTSRIFADLAERGVECAELVLHVGAGTFRPVREEDLAARRLHPEPFELPAATAEAVARTRERGGRVVAVGTTSARVLEACANASGGVDPGVGETDLFLLPGARFRVVDALLTNFHLPRSSLLLLVAAFAAGSGNADNGRDLVLHAYREAVTEGYRFYSYGDAMLLV